MSEIKITLPDGAIKVFPKGITGLAIAESISQKLGKESLAIEVNGKVKDLNLQINDDSKVKIIMFDSEEGPDIYWHSSSHIMAQAIEELFPGTKFGAGPATENGFYYDIDSPHQFTPEDFSAIEEKMKEISKRDLHIQREELSKPNAIKYFQSARLDPYKVEILEITIKDSDVVSIYHQGEFSDLCTGPHLPTTARLKAVKILSVSSSYWRGDESRQRMQRIYGITFPKQSLLDEYLVRVEEAKKRDHRKLGQELDLFYISPKVGGGLPLWLPKGTILRETLEIFLRDEQRKRGYSPVVTPHVGNIELYKTSGHYPYYKDSQFSPIKVDEEEYLLKPMNCPHHIQIFASRPRSYRDLPLRLAEFGTVYRYEQSGELNGLTRVRGFTVDDSHLFVTPDQLASELENVIDLIQYVFKTLGFEKFRTRLSFRDPENKAKFGGNDEQWEQAEADIKSAADKMKLDYFIGIGEAAFYGPKIDFMIKDVIGRTWQLGTVQVDYVLPERFQIEYTGADGQKHRPIMIHRAPFGSLERFIGILIEHYAGNFPTWLAPIQVAVLPISDNFVEYASTVEKALSEAGIRAKLDTRNEKIGYKIRDWETQKVPFMAVCGAKEMEANSVAVRQHGKGDQGIKTVDSFIASLIEEIKSRKQDH